MWQETHISSQPNKGLNILLSVVHYQNENEIICAKPIRTLLKERIHFTMLLEEYTQSPLNNKGILMVISRFQMGRGFILLFQR